MSFVLFSVHLAISFILPCLAINPTLEFLIFLPDCTAPFIVDIFTNAVADGADPFAVPQPNPQPGNAVAQSRGATIRSIIIQYCTVCLIFIIIAGVCLDWNQVPC